MRRAPRARGRSSATRADDRGPAETPPKGARRASAALRGDRHPDRRAGRRRREDRLGVGVPGPVSFRDGVPVSPPIMPGWDRFPVRELLTREHGCPTVVDSQVNLPELSIRRHVFAFMLNAVLILFGVSVLLAGSTFARFYLVSWVGERVVADRLRKQCLLDRQQLVEFVVADGPPTIGKDMQERVTIAVAEILRVVLVGAERDVHLLEHRLEDVQMHRLAVGEHDRSRLHRN